jgi:hypothetical protein
MSRILKFRWALLASLLVPLVGQDLAKLPDWARSPVVAAADEPAPAGADAWVLFDRTEVAYVGDGEIRTRRLRLVKILGERGFGEGTFTIQGLGGKSSEVKKLLGWNLRPDGELIKLDQNHVVTIDNASEAEASSNTLTGATLSRLAKGSLVAFESLQVIRHPMGPIDGAWILEKNPIRRWELEPAKKAGWFTSVKHVEIRVDRRHLQPWLTRISDLAGGGLAVDRVPPLPKDESFHPDSLNVWPQVFVRFLDPDLKGAPPWTDWNAFASWMYASYAEKQGTVLLEGLRGKVGKDGLEYLTGWMAKELQYRQVYLSPERGWLPLHAYEVGRLSYGDCKDLSCFLLAYAKSLGWEACPVLARIVNGVAEQGEPPSLWTFNHVIVAIRLKETLGLPAEVETPQGRFLLIDATDRFTPLGFLGAAHQDGRVLICTAQGGIWVQIPPSAIQPSKVAALLQGEADPQGALKATLRLQETGTGWGLRWLLQEQGLKKMRTHLLTNILDLPPTAIFEITRTGDPLDRLTPFFIEMELRHPEGFKRSGGEAYLAPLGWRIVPGQIQKPGVARQYPVRQLKGPEFEFTGTVKVPYGCVPILAAKEGDTPFRVFAWTAKATPEGAGTLLALHLQHRQKDAFFDFDRREEGVAAAKKDRSQVRNLIVDGLAFKVLP